VKTIKQIADEIGVSKTAVRNKITPEVKTKFSQTVSGVVYISSEGETIIKQGFNRTKAQTKFLDDSANYSENQFAQVSAEVSTLLSILQKELENKNDLISEQQQTIRELTAALENTTASLNAAQALHAGTMQQQLTDGNEEPDTPAKRFFARIFGRK